MKLIPLVLASLLAACGGCTAPAMFRGGSDAPSRADTLEAEGDRAVEIVGVTPMGTYKCSGVLVSDHQVVTAAHCARADAFLTAERRDGTQAIFQIEVIAPAYDFARLETVPGWFGEAPGTPHVGPVPEIGDQVCLAPVVPRRDHKCGEVQAVYSDGVCHDALTEHGNSGGGVYDASGRIIGIVSTLYTAANGQIIGGCAGTIPPDYTWLVQP